MPMLEIFPACINKKKVEKDNVNNVDIRTRIDLKDYYFAFCGTPMGVNCPAISRGEDFQGQISRTGSRSGTQPM